jgi:hypothetical protein
MTGNTRDVEKTVMSDPVAEASSAAKDAAGELQNIHHRIDAKLERSYLRKLDFYLLPFLSLMYLFNSVDRVQAPFDPERLK